MKRLSYAIASVLMLLMILGICSCETTMGEPENGEMRILAIGVDSDSSEACSNDAVNFSKAMKSLADQSGVSLDVTVVADTDRIDAVPATSENIANAIAKLSDESSENDISIVYLSGKGYSQYDMVDYNGKGVYYDAKDARFSADVDYSTEFAVLDADNNIVAYGDDLVSSLNEVNGNIVLIADSAHSGALVGSKSIEEDSTDFEVSSEDLESKLAAGRDGFDSSKVQILASERRYEEEAGTKALGNVEHSAFTAALLEALGYDQETETVTEVPPAMKNGKLTMSSLYEFVSKACKDGDMTPKMSSSLIDTILFTF